MVKIKTITPPKILAIDPQGIRHEINEYEFADLRLQIRNNKEKGWCWCEIDNSAMGAIDSYGDCDGYPKSLDLLHNLTLELAF